MHRRPKLTDADRELIQRLDRKGVHYTIIAKQLDRHPEGVRQFLRPPPRQQQIPPRREAEAADWFARLAEIPADTRDLTGRLLGDPLPARSALGRAHA